jgi:hypothetical protein
MGKHNDTHVGNEFLTPQMRMIVTSWMSEVAAEFKLQQETLFLAVALLDRFLAASSVRTTAAVANSSSTGAPALLTLTRSVPPVQGVPRGVLQLVAVTAVFIAAKQDEVRAAAAVQQPLLCTAAAAMAGPTPLRARRRPSANPHAQSTSYLSVIDQAWVC